MSTFTKKHAEQISCFVLPFGIARVVLPLCVVLVGFVLFWLGKGETGKNGEVIIKY